MSERTERLIVLTRRITAWPHEQVSLATLADGLDVAKSTVSEDVTVVRDTLGRFGLGDVVTQVGPSGGVRFHPALDVERTGEVLATLSRLLAQPDRLIGGGFLYMTDLLFDPRLMDPMGQLLAERLAPGGPQYVATVETKGIPLALAVARWLAVPVVLIRRDNRLSEGSSLAINYLSGSSHRIQSMSLARRSPVRGARVAYVDDFLKAGGTARAAADLLSEFQAEVSGVGVLVATATPTDKLVDGIHACLSWDESEGVRPAAWAAERVRPAAGLRADGLGPD